MRASIIPAILMAVSFGVIAPAFAADLPGAWTELAADGGLEVRAVVPGAAPCPKIVADGAVIATTRRGEPDAAYPVQTCVARVPPATRQLTADGLLAPVLPARLRRIVVVGDTGCRIKGSFAQDCNNPAAWPFATVARLAALQRPDLVIHVGDYHYRESPCPVGRIGCAGSPFGDNWAVWKADFFDPAAPLLAAAPWVLVRGNHEVCDRGGVGWFRLLDPHPSPVCSALTEPYALHLDRLSLLIFDSADADENKIDPARVAAFRGQLQTLLHEVKSGSWLLTHRPIWAWVQGRAPVDAISNITIQAATRDLVPKQLDMIVAGHIHDFAAYDFAGKLPVQLVTGEGGDLNDPITHPLKPGERIDGVSIRRGFATPDYGFLVLDRDGAGWQGRVISLDNQTVALCRFQGRSAECKASHP